MFNSIPKIGTIPTQSPTPIVHNRLDNVVEGQVEEERLETKWQSSPLARTTGKGWAVLERGVYPAYSTPLIFFRMVTLKRIVYASKRTSLYWGMLLFAVIVSGKIDIDKSACVTLGWCLIALFISIRNCLFIKIWNPPKIPFLDAKYERATLYKLFSYKISQFSFHSFSK